MNETQLRKLFKEELSSTVTLHSVPQLFDTKSAAKMLGISPGTLNNWRVVGKGPAVTNVEGAVRYQLAEINTWLDANTGGTV